MAQIQVVDYEAMPAQAREMRGYGKELNAELTKAYSSVAQMHEVWYGKRYNELVGIFNNMIPQLNEMLMLVVTEIPNALEIVANNYAQADIGRNITTANNEGPNRIANLTVSSDVGMKFITSSVFTAQKNISTNFKNAKDQMNKIESVYFKINWRSEASEAFKEKFVKLKTNIVKSFEEIDSQFTKLMQQTEQDIDRAEKANTVNTVN